MSSKIKVDQIENTSGSGDVAFTGTGGIKLDTIKSSGGTTGLTIDSVGRVSQPALPAFRVGLVSAQDDDNTTTLQTIQWTDFSETNNCFTQGGFSWSSGVVTVPIAGVYSFSVVLRMNNINTGYVVARIIKNNDITDNRELYIISQKPSASSSDYTNLTATGLFKLNASDNIRVTMNTGGTTPDTTYSVDPASTFSGHFIG